MKKYEEILKSYGIRPTFQRLTILKLISERKEHPSADEIYELLKDHTPAISRATVFNTVNLLSEKGVIEEIVTPRAIRYDYFYNEHNHFYCEKCGKVFDIEEKLPDVPKIEQIEGHKITKIQYLLTGICKDCLNK
ncbi:Fur family transcriptional regulator [Marinitoga sp. 38H-ov]|uniref:Fur family transcriptional regulator n=1 Tax=Marinitoga sp. 38H-ov TaxID=1755814 RepID=UPI0013EDF46A|nr:Fur family transcriptional regulator [Marinitoga sp. 38H-ov]KAF2956493.1 Fur family transcriptional regulator [Marinitoga sp. 38H-ov]